MRVSYYIRQAQDVYNDMRGRYEKICGELDKLTEKERELRRNANQYSAAGLTQRTEEVYAKQRQLKSELDGFGSEWARRTREIRDRCESMFAEKYGIDPKQVDQNGLALINSGLLSDHELLKLADSYTDNQAMRRFCGAAIEERGRNNSDDQLRAAGAAMVSKSQEQPHLAIFDGFCELQSRGIRTAENGMSFDNARIVSDGYNEQLAAQNYAKYSEMGEAIED